MSQCLADRRRREKTAAIGRELASANEPKRQRTVWNRSIHRAAGEFNPATPTRFRPIEPGRPGMALVCKSIALLCRVTARSVRLQRAQVKRGGENLSGRRRQLP